MKLPPSSMNRSSARSDSSSCAPTHPPPPPPMPHAPYPMSETFRPVRPSCRYCMPLPSQSRLWWLMSPAPSLRTVRSTKWQRVGQHEGEVQQGAPQERVRHAPHEIRDPPERPHEVEDLWPEGPRRGAHHEQ